MTCFIHKTITRITIKADVLLANENTNHTILKYIKNKKFINLPLKSLMKITLLYRMVAIFTTR